MSYINEPPARVSGAGHQFNYAVWDQNSQVHLCNVPWNNDYRDIVDFKTQADLDNYLSLNNAPRTTVGAVTYLRPGAPVRLSIPLNVAYQYNYMRVSNPAQPAQSGDMPKSFYYFILDVRHVAPETTEFLIQLDVWQTFGRGVKFGRCYVQNGHIGIAHDKADSSFGRRYLTIPEGFDTGQNMLLTYSNYFSLSHPNNASNSDKETGVVVVSTVNMEESGGTMNAPVLKSGTGETVNGVPSGANIYYFNRQIDFTRFLFEYRDKPWTTQGIVSAYMVPQMFVESDLTDILKFNPVQLGAITAYRMLNPDIYTRLKAGASQTGNAINWRVNMIAGMPYRYRHLTKFLTYPYSAIEISLFNAQPLILKPELMGSEFMDLLARFHLSMPNPRIAVHPIGYNSAAVGKEDLSYGTIDVNNPVSKSGEINQGDAALGEDLSFSTGLSNLPQIPVVNNSYAAYIANNTNQIAFQYDNADWSQQRALSGNQLGFNQATANMGLANEQTGIGVNTRNQTTNQSNVTGWYKGLQGVGTSLLKGSASGMVNSALDYGINMNQNNKQNVINNANAVAMNDAAVSNMGYMRDTNKTYADWAAQGDYANAIAGINARVQDTKMLQPTTAGQIGGEAFSFVANRGFKFRIVFKRIDNSAMEMIGEYWLRYGYAVHRFHQLNNLNVMDKFTYWKLLETNIMPDSKCPESYRSSIRGIFEKGVTVWANPDDINTLDIGNNKPRTGIKL